ncbi:MAG: D-3-phosphoglycerate dehydrogenase SerA [Candidatus Binatia bacterium]|nr:MAG: D-3-phosphoglycerate dehydrogenase SerA [Candidatus Binatia bacterium]
MRAWVTASFDPAGLDRLRRHMDVVYEDWRRTGTIYFDANALATRLLELGANVLVVEADFVHEEVFDRCDLRLVGCCRGDPVNVALAKATQVGVPVLFTPARNADSVADLAVAYMLCLLRHVYTVNEALKSGRMRFENPRDYLEVYTRFGGRELGSCTVGIVGLGAIGQRVARRVRAFGARVLATDPYASDDVFEACEAERRDLRGLLREADILTLHCPLTEATRRLLGREELRSMKPGSFLLNLARADIVEEEALYEALLNGPLAGAALDVFWVEPVQSDNRFVRLPNVLASPHLGGATADVVRRQTEMIVSGIESWLRGERPRNLANPEVRFSVPPRN